MRTLIALTALVLGTLAGCGAREHISPNHGDKYHQAFQKQRVHQEPAKGAPSGLEAEEASAINRTYRKSMGAPDEKQSEATQVLMLQPPKAEGQR
jgi:hypothetical protein